MNTQITLLCLPILLPFWFFAAPHSFRFCLNWGTSLNTNWLAFGFHSCLVSYLLTLTQPGLPWCQNLWRSSDEWREINVVTTVLFEHSDKSLMQATKHLDLSLCHRSLWARLEVEGKKLWLQSAFLAVTLYRKNVIFVRCGGGGGRIGRLSAAVLTQLKCRATILTGLRWRESRGCWPVLRHSWNSKQQSQELKHYTQAFHTPLLSH